MPRFLLLGGSLRSGNRGIHAITLGTMHCLREMYTDAQLTIASFSSPTSTTSSHKVSWKNRQFSVQEATTSAPKGAWAGLRTLVTRTPAADSVLRHFWWADVVIDLSFGDGFGETYGFRTLFRHSVGKYLALRVGKPLVVFPQTIGPFQTKMGRSLAQYLLRRASLVCVREKTSEKVVQDLLGPTEKVFCLTDLAFLMERPEALPSLPVEIDRKGPIVGINVSGFLWNRGYEIYAHHNPSFDYRQMIVDLVQQLVDRTDRSVMLIPHVFSENPRTCDLVACQAAKKQLGPLGNRVVSLEQSYSAPELKAIIGQCEFFVGSRMHACIAALSTETPVVPISYSHKFAGILAQFGIEEWVVDPAVLSQEQAVDLALSAHKHRDDIRKLIAAKLPTVRADAMQAGKLLRTVRPENAVRPDSRTDADES